jgi:hypothetical protein
MEEMIERKQLYEEQIADIFEVYLEKYINKLFDYVDRDMKMFKRKLVDIASWNEEKVTKEYNKFLKWTGKKSIEEAEVKNMLDNVIMYSIRLMINKYDTEVIAKLVEFESTDPERFFYKCMKRIAKFVYENPNSIKLEEFNQKVKNIVVSVIYEFVPIAKIIKLLEVTKEGESEKSYDFNKTFTTDEPEGAHTKPQQKLVIDKQTTTSDNELNYVPSEEIIKEYYQSDKEDKNENEKLINIPKTKKKRN